VTAAEVLVVEVPAMLARTDVPSAQQAITALYVQHYRSLMRQALALVDHETTAEEIVQDAFEQLLRRWSTLQPCPRRCWCTVPSTPCCSAPATGS
jgi:DNA-directed RNA polymerase specialized sigma24 family protein